MKRRSNQASGWLAVGLLGGAIATVAAAAALGRADDASGFVNTKPGGCDRQCLRDTADRYLEAMVQDEPKLLRWTRDARYTENGMQLRVGEGLWATASALTAYRIYAIDPPDGEIGVITVVSENGLPAMLGLRLKVVNHQISEAEHIVARSAQADGPAATLGKQAAPAIFASAVPAGQRADRAALVAAANGYFNAIEQSDGGLAHFAAHAVRIENGAETCGPESDKARSGGATPSRGAGVGGDSTWRQMMSLGCAQQMSSGMYSYITQARDRRIDVVDQQTGDVMAFVIFSHPGNVAAAHMPGYPVVTMPAAARRPFDTQLAELFKVQAGEIQQVEAVINSAAYGVSSGWDTAADRPGH